MIKFEILKDNILNQKVDVIVNSTSQSLSVGIGGVNGAIHTVAGVDLAKECSELGGCSIGKAKLTMSYDLLERDVPWIIHAVGPRYAGDMYFEADLLRDVYQAALDLTLNYKKVYKNQCLEVLDKYIGHLHEDIKKSYIKDTSYEVETYCLDHPISSMAFPSISTGNYGYPVEEAAKIAIRTIKNFCHHYDHLDVIKMVCYDKETYNIYKELL